jgi:hypothetical protein
MMATMRRTALIAAFLCVACSAQTVMSGWDVLGFGSTIPSVTGPGDLNADGSPDVVLGGGGCVRVWSGFDGTLLWHPTPTAP